MVGLNQVKLTDLDGKASVYHVPKAGLVVICKGEIK